MLKQVQYDEKGLVFRFCALFILENDDLKTGFRRKKSYVFYIIILFQNKINTKIGKETNNEEQIKSQDGNAFNEAIRTDKISIS